MKNKLKIISALLLLIIMLNTNSAAFAAPTQTPGCNTKGADYSYDNDYESANGGTNNCVQPPSSEEAFHLSECGGVLPEPDENKDKEYIIIGVTLLIGLVVLVGIVSVILYVMMKLKKNKLDQKAKKETDI